MKLSEVEKRWAQAATEAMFPTRPGARVNVPYARVDLGASFDETLQRVPFRVALGMRFAIWVLALAPFFVMGRLVTLRSLEPSERDRVLGRLVGSPSYLVRQITLLFKAFVALFVFRDLGLRDAVLRRREPLVQLAIKKDTHHAVA